MIPRFTSPRLRGDELDRDRDARPSNGALSLPPELRTITFEYCSEGVPGGSGAKFELQLLFGAPEGRLLKNFWNKPSQESKSVGLAGVFARYGGARGSRTPDLLNAIQALSQLSYGPISCGGGHPPASKADVIGETTRCQPAAC